MVTKYKELIDINRKTHGNNWIYDNSFNECVRLKNNQPPKQLVPFLIGGLNKDISPKDNKANNPIHMKLFCKFDHKIDEKNTLKIIKTPPIVGVPAF